MSSTVEKVQQEIALIPQPGGPRQYPVDEATKIQREATERLKAISLLLAAELDAVNKRIDNYSRDSGKRVRSS